MFVAFGKYIHMHAILNKIACINPIDRQILLFCNLHCDYFTPWLFFIYFSASYKAVVYLYKNS